MAVAIHVTTDVDRGDLEECLSSLCTQAKAEARRGYAGVRGSRYEDLHRNINLILDAWSDALVTRGDS